MLDHISIRVQDLPRALAFYRAALAPIGYEVLMEFPGVVGLGADGKPDLWLMKSDQPVNPTHLALASRRDRIDAFHAAALRAGASDNGGPGIRAHYHPNYYAAFVYDPEGNNLEVVCHDPPAATRATPRRATAKRAAAGPANKTAKATTKKLPRKPAPKPPRSVPKGKPAKRAKPAKGRGKR
jgi:catechol 2,3-dioxygenase-like lactoylglutathione lyase family enzyme